MPWWRPSRPYAGDADAKPGGRRLDEAEQDPLALAALVAEPYRAEDMAARVASPMVNSAGFDAPECIAPAGEEEGVGQGGCSEGGLVLACAAIPPAPLGASGPPS